jgi:hypothetical protein
LWIDDKSLGKPKAFQVNEEKVLMEDTVSVMVRIMSLNGKYISGEMGCPIRSSQSKGTSLGLGGRAFGGRIYISHSEGGRCEMLMTWMKCASFFLGRVGLTRDFTGVAISSIIG